MPAHALKTVFFLVGCALFWFILRSVDLTELLAALTSVGPAGFAAITAIYLGMFGSDVLGWQLTFSSLDMNWRWTRRLFAIRLIGEAANTVIPAASMGGEPVKAILLKAQHGVSFREGSATVILARTINMLALVPFLWIGIAFARGHESGLGGHLDLLVFAALAMTAVIINFYCFQRFRLSSAISRRFGNSRIGAWIARVGSVIEDVDAHFTRFYIDQPGHFAMSMAIAFVGWLFGVIEVYLGMRLLGFPVTWTEAWIIEAVFQLVRAGTFFIPAGLGTHEGALLLASTALTGSPVAGVAFALVRRARELVWIVFGLATIPFLAPRQALAAAKAARGFREV